MRAKLIVEGKEFDIDIFDPELQKLVAPKKTGYERVNDDEDFYCPCLNGCDILSKSESFLGDSFYEGANYYSSKEVALNNLRADKLMRQLRRFSVLNRDEKLDWNDANRYKYEICYNHASGQLVPYSSIYMEGACSIYFDSGSHAQAAIETFRSELIWYFTEYKDSL